MKVRSQWATAIAEQKPCVPAATSPIIDRPTGFRETIQLYERTCATNIFHGLKGYVITFSLRATARA